MSDATKAFDREKSCKLFNLLTERNLPTAIIRILLNMYTSNLVRMSWNGICSC